MPDLLTIPFQRSAYPAAVALATAYAAADADTLGDMLEDAGEDELRALLMLLSATVRAFAADRGIEPEAVLQSLGVTAAVIAASTPDEGLV